MAQEVQIVPRYLHSHVETYINDYTEFEDAAYQPVDTNNKSICVFRSSKGIDNLLVEKRDLRDFKKTYGSSNFKKYGQPLMMPMAMLKSEAATVYCMRIMPEDAFAANSILTMLYKTDPDTGKFIVKYRVSYVTKDEFDQPSMYSTQKNFKKQLMLSAEALRNDEPDEDGFCAMPIATFRVQGRGIYGNNYRWRIVRNYDYENDYGIKMFTFEILTTESGLSTVTKSIGACVTSTKYTNITLINDILDELSMGEVYADVQMLEDNYIEVYEKFKTFVESLDEDMQDEIPDVDEFDPFFGYGVATNIKNTNIEIISEADDTDDVSVDRPQGIPMMGGEDGAFSETNDAQSIYREEVKTYVAAFNGELDKYILSKRRTPCDILLDANYPFEVKEALADLANFRESGLCYIDAGTETRLAQIDNIVEQYSIFNTRNLSKEWQHYITKDPDTKKKCEVTTTYFFAEKIIPHFKKFGSHVPFTKAYAQLSGHIKNSLEPAIDDLDLDIKEKLYVNRINYFETIEENVYQRCSQNTAQMINSDLMEENNMNTLFELRTLIERDCWNNLYNFTSAEDRARFSESEKAKFVSWEGVKLDTFDIKFDVNEWEAERSIMHCYIDIQFRNLNKRTIIEIDVNKRNFLG